MGTWGILREEVLGGAGCGRPQAGVRPARAPPAHGRLLGRKMAPDATLIRVVRRKVANTTRARTSTVGPKLTKGLPERRKGAAMKQCPRPQSAALEALELAPPLDMQMALRGSSLLVAAGPRARFRGPRGG